MNVVYVADDTTQGVQELYRVPLDASLPPVALNPPFPATADVSAFALSPDGQRVLYLADPNVDGRVELFTVALGGGAVVTVNGPLVTGGKVRDFRITPSSARLVYRADEVVRGRLDLFGAPIDGPADAVLTQMGPSQNVGDDYRITADSTHAVLRADALVNGTTELFVVPVDGSAPLARISDALTSSGNVTGFALDPGDARAVYRADQRTNDVFELFSVPLAGGPSALLDPMPLTGDVDAFRIAPDGAAVLYLANRDDPTALELFSAPLDASAPPRRVNHRLRSFSAVQADFVPLAGGAALYRADQEELGLVELFLRVADHAPRAGTRPTVMKTVTH